MAAPANSPLPRGVVANITVTDPGSGYITPVVTIADVYGTGTGASAQVTGLDPTTRGITAIQVTNPGTQYTAPVVIITDSGAAGSGALATAVIGGPFTGGIRKFVNTLPGLGVANDLGQYIPVAIPDKTTYPNSDYYELELGEYTQKMHLDLQPTTLRGYRQTNTTDYG